MCSFICWQLYSNNTLKITWQLRYNYLCLVAADQQHSSFILFVESLWRKKDSCHSAWSWLQAENQVAWCPIDGWGGWGYVTKHLASSFQRHMDLHKHILLCVCRFQTHCLTQSPEAKLQWVGMRPDEREESELLGHSSSSNVHFYFRGFLAALCYMTWV